MVKEFKAKSWRNRYAIMNRYGTIVKFPLTKLDAMFKIRCHNIACGLNVWYAVKVDVHFDIKENLVEHTGLGKINKELWNK